MCTYNGSRFLREQLATIASQTRPPDEMVVCDDGSSDASLEILGEFSRRVPFPVRVYVSDTNLGSTKNFEKAIALAEGDVIALADQDDAWYPNKLERIERELVSSTEAIAVFSDAHLVNEDSVVIGKRLWKSLLFTRSEQKRFADGQSVKVLIKHPVVTGATMAFRRRLLPLLSPIPEQDVHDRWMSFLLAALGRVTLIPEPLMSYRLHTQQQIGVGTLTFSDRLLRARQTGTDAYLAEISRFRQLYSRLYELRAEFPRVDATLLEITNKIAHLEHRIEMHEAGSGRLPRILREIRNQRYWHYSAGWESVAKDVFLYGQHSS